MADKTNKEVVIAMRNALKANCNWPVKVYADNNWVIVDESNKAAFTKWDDENGLLYYFRLVDPIHNNIHQSTKPVVSVAAIKYEFIQAMEVAPFPCDKLDDLFSSIETASNNVSTFSSEFKEKIKHVMSVYQDSNLVELYPDLINAIHGTNVVKTDNDYYAGRMGYPKKETTYVTRYNKEVEEIHEREEASESQG